MLLKISLPFIFFIRFSFSFYFICICRGTLSFEFFPRYGTICILKFWQHRLSIFRWQLRLLCAHANSLWSRLWSVWLICKSLCELTRKELREWFCYNSSFLSNATRLWQNTTRSESMVLLSCFFSFISDISRQTLRSAKNISCVTGRIVAIVFIVDNRDTDLHVHHRPTRFFAHCISIRNYCSWTSHNKIHLLVDSGLLKHYILALWLQSADLIPACNVAYIIHIVTIIWSTGQIIFFMLIILCSLCWSVIDSCTKDALQGGYAVFVEKLA